MDFSDDRSRTRKQVFCSHQLKLIVIIFFLTRRSLVWCRFAGENKELPFCLCRHASVDISNMLAKKRRRISNLAEKVLFTVCQFSVYCFYCLFENYINTRYLDFSDFQSKLFLEQELPGFPQPFKYLRPSNNEFSFVFPLCKQIISLMILLP